MRASTRIPMLRITALRRQEAEKFSAEVFRFKRLTPGVMLQDLIRFLFAKSKTARSCPCGREGQRLL